MVRKIIHTLSLSITWTFIRPLIVKLYIATLQNMNNIHEMAPSIAYPDSFKRYILIKRFLPWGTYTLTNNRSCNFIGLKIHCEIWNILFAICSWVQHITLSGIHSEHECYYFDTFASYFAQQFLSFNLNFISIQNGVTILNALFVSVINIFNGL